MGTAAAHYTRRAWVDVVLRIGITAAVLTLVSANGRAYARPDRCGHLQLHGWLVYHDVLAEE